MSLRLCQAWWREVGWPTVFFVFCASGFYLSDWDLGVANAWFFDHSQGGWLGAHNWWVESFLHTGDGGRSA